jgi:hypothetical protein
MGAQLERTATLVVRIWTEAGPPPGLRARVTRTFGQSVPETTVVVVDRVEDLTGAVRTWLESFMALVDTENQSSPENGRGRN